MAFWWVLSGMNQMKWISFQFPWKRLSQSLTAGISVYSLARNLTARKSEVFQPSTWAHQLGRVKRHCPGLCHKNGYMLQYHLYINFHWSFKENQILSVLHSHIKQISLKPPASEWGYWNMSGISKNNFGQSFLWLFF